MSIKISNQRYEEIKRIVVRMFVKYGISCVPINGFEIAHKMGIKVIPYSAIAPSKRWLLIKKSEAACYAYDYYQKWRRRYYGSYTDYEHRLLCLFDQAS